MTYQIHYGDCMDFLPKLESNSIAAVVTDPPYGIKFRSNHREASEKFDYIIGDDAVPEDWFGEAFRVTRQDGCMMCFCRWDTAEDFRVAMTDNGWIIKSQVIWDRVVHGSGDLERQFGPQHDTIWFAVKSNEFRFPGDRPKSVYRFMRVNGNNLVHPSQKPLALMERIVLDLTKPGDIVLDPFCGSGTTGAACVKHNRDFIGIEKSKGYYLLAGERLKAFQQQPVLF